MVEKLPQALESADSLIQKGLKPDLTREQLNAAGIEPVGRSDGKLKLMRLQSDDGAQYWLGHHNFYVITRYNHSKLYAMAVWQLSQSIKAELGKQSQ